MNLASSKIRPEFNRGGSSSHIVKSFTLFVLFCSSLLYPLHGETIAEPRDSLLGLFPDSKAPEEDVSNSEFEVSFEFHPERYPSQWHPGLDESKVFHARLKHHSESGKWWDFGIGKGGQLYSMVSSFGEAIAPQNQVGRWTDEVWQLTSIQGRLLGREIPKKRGQEEISNSFMQSGLYIRNDETPYFYSPILAENVDMERRSYSVLCWQIIPDPSINRSGMLAYNQYRDLGDGVIEVTYIMYNFSNYSLDNISPWGGVRTSTFPDGVLSNPDGTYRQWLPVEYAGKGVEFSVDLKTTGGWAAMTEDSKNPEGKTLGLVFGNESDQQAENSKRKGKSTYDSGMTHLGRDYTVQALNFPVNAAPGTAYLARMYFVLGTLTEVAKKSNELAKFATAYPIEFPQNETPLVDLYLNQSHDQHAILSRKPSGSNSKKICQVFAYPVPNSMPLFVIRDNEAQKHFVTTDPYAKCLQEPFENPFPPDSPYYHKYNNRKVYRPYAGKTEWVELLGFVTTSKQPGFEPIADILELNAFYYSGDGKDAGSVFVHLISE